MPSRLEALTDLLATRWGLRLLRWAVIVLMVCGLAACVATGANRPADPRLEGQSPDPRLEGQPRNPRLEGQPRNPRLEGQSRVPGFGEVAFRVIPPPGSGMTAGQYCGLLAETEAQVQRGLMGRRDLAGYDGMVFRFAEDSRTSFYMLNVPVPLTVAWFDAEGRFVSSADMEPCLDRADCPLYPPARPYRLALEVLSGGLGRLGVGPGSVMEVGGACEPR